MVGSPFLRERGNKPENRQSLIGGDVNIAYEFKVLPEQSRRNIMMENAVRFNSLDV